MLRFLPGVPRRCGVDVSVMDTNTPPSRIQSAHPHLQDHQPAPGGLPERVSQKS